jgi:hypothetical protein
MGTPVSPRLLLTALLTPTSSRTSGATSLLAMGRSIQSPW